MKIDTRRRGLYGKIEVAKKQLGLDDDAYRDILVHLFAVRTRTSLNIAQLEELVRHFESLGFRPRSKAGTAGRPEHAKMRALWLSLYHLGLVRDPSDRALSAFARRVTGGKQTGVAALTWVRGANAYKVIEALKEWGTRDAGVTWGSNPREDVLRAQMDRAFKLQVPCAKVHEVMKPLAGDPSAERYDAVIAELGGLIRGARKAAVQA
ncbi:MAG: phage protein GemA/Gp16 family protein [Alphaproteobacteria bacterium]